MADDETALLQHAICSGSIGAVHRIIDECDGALRQLLKLGPWPLETACCRNDVDMVECLLNLGSRDDRAATQEKSARWWAVYFRNAEMVQLLSLEDDTDPVN
jgi:ankyrin repeat protein